MYTHVIPQMVNLQSNHVYILNTGNYFRYLLNILDENKSTDSLKTSLITCTRECSAPIMFKHRFNEDSKYE